MSATRPTPAARAGAALLLALALPAGAAAELLVQQAQDPAGTGSFSNLGPAHQQTADNFRLARPVALAELSWFGRYGARFDLDNPVAFAVRFFADDGGRPALVALREFAVAVAAVDTGLTFRGAPGFRSAAPLGGWELGPGGYGVSVVEADPRTPASGTTSWLWGRSAR